MAESKVQPTIVHGFMFLEPVLVDALVIAGGAGVDFDARQSGTMLWQHVCCKKDDHSVSYP